MRPRRDLVIGLVLGVAIGVAAIVLFLFLESRSAIDDPVAGEGLTVPTGLPRQRPRRVATVRVRGGAPAGSITDIRATRGERVRFRVTSDSAITIVVEGLSVGGDVPAGGTTTFSFTPRRAGEFAVIVAASHIGVARLIVSGGASDGAAGG